MIIRFDDERHREFVRSVVESASAITTELQGLETTAARLRGRWSGDAQEAFDAARAQWVAQMADIRDLLETATVLASSTRARFVDAEASALAMWE